MSRRGQPLASAVALAVALLLAVVGAQSLDALGAPVPATSSDGVGVEDSPLFVVSFTASASGHAVASKQPRALATVEAPDPRPPATAAAPARASRSGADPFRTISIPLRC
jgi:hypothetical protein